LRGPSGEALGTDLENMFSKISRKRRASALEAHAQGETYLGAPTPAGDGLEPFEGFNDYDVDIDTGDFDRERFNQFQVTTPKKSPFLCNPFTLNREIPKTLALKMDLLTLKLMSLFMKVLAEHLKRLKTTCNSMVLLSLPS
jgi:hypothetical protein